MTPGPVSPRVLVVEHESSCPPALLGDWLVEAGCVLDVRRPYSRSVSPELPRTLADHDALLVLGGAMDAGDDTHRWLPATRSLVVEADAAAVPTLGVCLGHQLAALATGGEVGRRPGGQIVGLFPIGWSDAAARDPLLGPLASAGPASAVFWNQDVVTSPPPGADVLARAGDGELQAARFGGSTWGVQWHPEVDAAILADWAEHEAERHLAAGLDQQAILDEVEAARTQLDAAGRALAASFTRLARARAERAA